MKKNFTIATRRCYGLNNAETSILQFEYDPEHVSDVLTQVRRAVGDYLKTEDGKTIKREIAEYDQWEKK